jgi:hypothetical protein
MRAHFNRITSGGGAGMLVGFGMWMSTGGTNPPTPIPVSYWVGIGFMAVGVIVGIYGWFGKPYKEIKQLGDIKSLLVDINTCERNAAVKKSKQRHSSGIIKRVAGDAYAVFSSSMPSFAAAVESGEGNIDYLIGIYSKLANILDIENYGLNSELSGTVPYEQLHADLARKRGEIQAGKRKTELIQKNIDRISALTYGVNSYIIHKGIIKSAPKSKQPPVKMMMNIEAVDNAARKALPRLLNDLGKQWKWKVKPDEPDSI